MSTDALDEPLLLPDPLLLPLPPLLPPLPLLPLLPLDPLDDPDDPELLLVLALPELPPLPDDDVTAPSAVDASVPPACELVASPPPQAQRLSVTATSVAQERDAVDMEPSLG
jgi:hypothetical protein